ncbi:hypothetical protein EDB89DRAFT_1853207, partial [Lactarius sanguifluus]
FRDLVLHVIPDSPPNWIRAVQKHVVLLIPCLISPVISPLLLPTSAPQRSATESPNSSIPIPLPPDPPPPTPSEPPDLLPSVDPTRKQLCATRVPGNATCLQSVLDTFFQTPISREVEERRIFLNKDPAQYLLAIQQMVENNHSSVPCRRSSKPEGRIEMPKLRPMHPYCVDTTLLFHHPTQPTFRAGADMAYAQAAPSHYTGPR